MRPAAESARLRINATHVVNRNRSSALLYHPSGHNTNCLPDWIPALCNKRLMSHQSSTLPSLFGTACTTLTTPVRYLGISEDPTDTGLRGLTLSSRLQPDLSSVECRIESSTGQFTLPYLGPAPSADNQRSRQCHPHLPSPVEVQVVYPRVIRAQSRRRH